MDINYQVNWEKRRCQIGFHNYNNFMEGEVRICKRCGHMTTPRELQERQHYEENNGD